MSTNDEPTLSLYSDKDIVEVCDANGLAIPGLPVAPKAWLGTALVPSGTKKGTPKTLDEVVAAAAGGDTGSSTSTRAPRTPGTEPPKSGAGSGIAEWEAYAREKGAKDEDLLDDTAEPLTREALITKYGTPAS